MTKDLKVAVLLDCYGRLLPDKQRRLVEQYYYDDLSLSEISENEGITRQGARDSINRAVEKLYEYEEKLCFAAKSAELKKCLEQYKNQNIPEKISELINNL